MTPGLGKTLKQKAVVSAIGPAMALVESWTKDIHAQNEIATFIEGNLGILFAVPAETEEQIEGITPLLVKIMTAEANERPAFSEKKLLEFYEAFRVFYRDLAATRQLHEYRAACAAARIASGSPDQEQKPDGNTK